MRTITKAFACFSMALSVAAIASVGSISYAAGNKSQTLETHYENYKEWWMFEGSIPDIIGEEYLPSSKSKSLMDKAEKEGIDLMFNPSILKEDEEGKEFYKVLGQTSSFTLFHAGKDETMVLKTEDSKYIHIECPGINFQVIYPDVIEYDLDEDGENEFAIIPHLLRGTGYSEESMYIADLNDKSKWAVYVLNPEDYLSDIAKNIEAKVSNDQVSLYVNGKKEGNSVPVADIYEDFKMGLYLESVIDFEVFAGKIWIGVYPMFDMASMNDPGVALWYQINYEGENNYTGEKLVCRPDFYTLYQDYFSTLSENELEYCWKNPNFEAPLILLADEKDCIVDEEQYATYALACSISIMKNGKMQELETIKSDSKDKPLAISPDGIVVPGDHSLYVYGADPESGELTILDGVEDNTISNFSKHTGYIRIRNGKAEKITKKEYQTVCEMYSDATPILFSRR